ncbi:MULTISPECIES: FMN-binding negative transcriptional regulator [unclassified Shinella]|jgi:transcriptional regulator|uniref:FMN-binding negative transcriptional regulator n=1 Tax=unclassified Shinella TaxID=2643062 RepID=UPI0003C53063|nr:MULTISPECIES: FMN-binding negative transcriptional regulator [unclassified Shinella]EYR84629.1 protease synthase and sporulation protein PAI 2 [Shinella sp. DD12]MCA0338810.1 FMN-binding negative transcriptional regulator [Pseudomonadota bacterium]TAA52830.1 FMN-binding negative transcriptional regulator [Shinella sp. JR1-6]
MFTSTSFGEADEREIRDLISRYGLATLVSHSPSAGLQATALPALFDPDDPSGQTLIGHMARANPHWRSIMDGDAVLLLFRGPDAYVSPGHYRAEEDVPTWNYSAVQLRGHLRHAPDAAENDRVLLRTVEHFEARLGQGWRLGDISPETVKMYSKGTASFSIAVTSIEAAHKMSQDKRRTDVVAVIEGLATSDDKQARAVAETMERITLHPGRHRPDS